MGRKTMHATNELAWSGWTLRAPEDWRVYKIDGNWKSGAMLVGDDEGLCLQVKWRRRAQGDPDAEALAERAGADVQQMIARDGLRVFCVRGVPAKKGTRQDRWYASNARLSLELAASSEADPALRRAVERDVVPSVSLAAPGAPTRWAFYGSSFESPPGFVLDKHKLRLGDHALSLLRGDERMLLRQVTPGSLALQRRKASLWLRDEPFRNKRRRRVVDETDAQLVERTMLPLPLSFLRRRWEVTALEHDENRDRLLLLRWESKSRPGTEQIGKVLAAMHGERLEEAAA